MSGRSFTSKPDSQSEVTEFTFELDEETFTCELRSDADSVLEWSEMAAGAAEEEADMESAAGAAFMARFFRLVLGDGEYTRFRHHLRQHHTGAETLMEIMQAINEEMQTVVEDASDRPTEPSSRSSAGQRARGGRTTARQPQDRKPRQRAV